MKYKGYKKYKIKSKGRLEELRGFSRQYYDWLSELEAIKVLGSPSLSGMPHGSDVNSAVENVAIKRERYQDRIAMVDKCIRLCSSDESLRTAVKYSVTTGCGFPMLKKKGMVFYEQEAFYLARQRYYFELDRVL